MKLVLWQKLSLFLLVGFLARWIFLPVREQKRCVWWMIRFSYSTNPPHYPALIKRKRHGELC